jgi:pyrroloquinoline quinone biosynthesis protein B
LREGTPLEIYGTSAVLASLTEIFPIGRIVQSYAPFQWLEVRVDEPFRLDDGRLQVTPFRLGVKRPRYTVGSRIDGDWVIGYRFEDLRTGGIAVYAPAIEAWTEVLAEQLSKADYVFVDGTFWSEDEMIKLGASALTAREMGHIPISGPGGSAQHLAALSAPQGKPGQRKIYVHINNTNAVLAESSPERRFLIERGIEIGWDGQELEI